MTDVPVSIVITAQERAAASLERVEKSVNRLDRAFGSLSGRLKAGLQWHITYNAIRMVENAIRGLINVIPNLISRGEAWASTVDDIADATGMAAEQASELAAVQSMLGGSTAKLSASMAIFAKNVETSPKIMQELGAQIVRAKDGSVDAYATFQNLRTAIAETGASTRSTRFAMQLLGRGARDLLDLLLLSPRAFRSYAAEARRMGLILSEAGLAAAEQWKRTKSMLDLAVTGIGAQVLQAAAPALTALVNGITKVLEQNMENIARFAAQAVGFIAGLISGLLGIPIQLDLVTASVKDAGAGTGRVWDGIKKQEQAAGDAANRSTKAIEGQVDAIDRKLAAIDRAEDRRQARQEYRELQRDLAEARRDLRNVRDQSVLAATMSNAEAELARQAKARDVKEATSKVRTAEEALAKWRHEQRTKERREALEAQRAAIQDQVGAMRAGMGKIASGLSGAFNGGGKGGGIGGAGVKLSDAIAKRMKDAMKDAQKYGLSVAETLKDAILGEDNPVASILFPGSVPGVPNINVTTRSGGLIGALQAMQTGLQNVGDWLSKTVGGLDGLSTHIANLDKILGGGDKGGGGNLLPAATTVGVAAAIRKLFGFGGGKGGGSGKGGLPTGTTPNTGKSLLPGGLGGLVLSMFGAQPDALGNEDPRVIAMYKSRGMVFRDGKWVQASSSGMGTGQRRAGSLGAPKRTSLAGDGSGETLPVSIAAWQRLRSRNPFGFDGSVRGTLGGGSGATSAGGGGLGLPVGGAGGHFLGLGAPLGGGFDLSGVGGGSAASASKTLQSLLPFGRRFFDFGSPVGSLLNDNLGATTQAGQATQQTATNTKNLPTGVPIRGIVPVKGATTGGRLPITGTVGAVGPRGGAVPTAGTTRLTNTSVPVKGGVRVENRPEVRGTVGITAPGGGVAATIATVRNRVGITGDVGVRGRAKVQGVVEATNAAFARIGQVTAWLAPALPVKGTVGVTGAKGGGVPITGAVHATNAAFSAIGTIRRWAAPSLPVRGVVGVTGAKGGAVPTAGTTKVTNTVPVSGNVGVPKGVPVRGRVAVSGNVGVPRGVAVQGAVEATNTAFGDIGKVKHWSAGALNVGGTVGVTGAKGGSVPVSGNVGVPKGVPVRGKVAVAGNVGVPAGVRVKGGAVEATNEAFGRIGRVDEWNAPALPVSGKDGGAVQTTTRVINRLGVTVNKAPPVSGAVEATNDAFADIGRVTEWAAGRIGTDVKGAVSATNPAFGLIGKVVQWAAPPLRVTGAKGGAIEATARILNKLNVGGGVRIENKPQVTGAVEATNKAFGRIGKVDQWTAPALPVRGNVGVSAPGGGAVNVKGNTKITNPVVPVGGAVEATNERFEDIGKVTRWEAGSIAAKVRGTVAASNPAFGLIGKITGISTTQALGVNVGKAPPVKGSVEATNAAFGKIGKVESITATESLGVTGAVGITGPVSLELVTAGLLMAIAANTGASRLWTDLMKPITTSTGLLVRGGVRVVSLDRVIGLLGRVADGIDRFAPYFGAKGLLVETGTVPVTLPGTQPVDVRNEKVTVGVPSLPNVTIGDVAKRIPTAIDAVTTLTGNLPVGVQNRVGTKIEAADINVPTRIENDRVPVGVQNRAGVKIEATDINVPVGVKNDRLSVGVANKPDVTVKKGDLWPAAVLVQLGIIRSFIVGIYTEGIRKDYATFAEGTPFVQSTGPAVIHRGEMIVPRRLSDAIRSNAATLSASGATPAGGGGGGSRIDLTLVLDGRVLARAMGLFVGPGTSTVRANLST